MEKEIGEASNVKSREEEEAEAEPLNKIMGQDETLQETQDEDAKPQLPEALMNLMVMEVLFPDTDSPLQTGDDDDGEADQNNEDGGSTLPSIAPR